MDFGHTCLTRKCMQRVRRRTCLLFNCNCRKISKGTRPVSIHKDVLLELATFRIASGRMYLESDS